MADDEYIPKPKLKRVERKLVPVLEKLSVDELMETNTYQKFNQSIDRVFENVEDADMSLDVGKLLEVQFYLYTGWRILSRTTAISHMMRQGDAPVYYVQLSY